MRNDFKHSELTDQIINAYYTVYNTLGYGFLEKVYENSMLIELRKSGLNVENQKEILVYYDSEVVGKYYTDLLVEGKVLVELKVAQLLLKEPTYQLINYLKASNIEVGLLLNFGRIPEFKRKIYSNKKLHTDDTD